MIGSITTGTPTGGSSFVTGRRRGRRGREAPVGKLCVVWMLLVSAFSSAPLGSLEQLHLSLDEAGVAGQTVPAARHVARSSIGSDLLSPLPDFDRGHDGPPFGACVATVPCLAITLDRLTLPRLSYDREPRPNGGDLLTYDANAPPRPALPAVAG